MERYIKYKRISKKFKNNYDKSNEYETQKFFDDLISDGWEIIYYDETIEKTTIDSNHLPELEIVVVVGRKQKIEL